MAKFFDNKNSSSSKEKSPSPDLAAVAKNIAETKKIIGDVHQTEKNIKSIREKIEKKLERTNDELREYISDSKNFTTEQWQALQKKSKELKKTITSAGLLKYYRKGNVLDEFLNEGDDASSQRKRKGKLAGARRKWIPMP